MLFTTRPLVAAATTMALLLPAAAQAAPLVSFDVSSSAIMTFDSFVFLDDGSTATLGSDYEIVEYEIFADSASYTEGTGIVTTETATAGAFNANIAIAGSADAPFGYIEIFADSYYDGDINNLSGRTITATYTYTLQAVANTIAGVDPNLFFCACALAGADAYIYVDTTEVFYDIVEVLEAAPLGPFDPGPYSTTVTDSFNLLAGESAEFAVGAFADGIAFVAPVPLAPALPLLASALGGLALVRRRR